MRALIFAVLILSLFAAASADTANGTVTVTGAPNITINNPSASSWHNANFTINATITGAPIAANYRWENSSSNGNYTVLSYSGSQIWNVTFSITSVADGSYTIRVNTTDSAGSKDNETAAIYIDDTNPTISSFTLLKTGTILQGSSLGSADFSCSASDNGGSFGGALTTVMTGISTSTAGTKTATCTATDSASNSATATVSYSVSDGGPTSGGGGGAGGTEAAEEVAPAPIQQETAIVSTTGAVKEVNIETSNPDVTNILLEFSGPANVVVDVKSLSSAPENVAPPGDAVYKYLDISTDAPDGAITKAKIKFKVEKSWLAQQQATSPDDVILAHYKDGNWNNLGTSRVDEDSNYFYYTADAESFSIFAIILKAQPPAAGAAAAFPALPLSADKFVMIAIVAVLAVSIILAERNRKGSKGRRNAKY